MTDIATVLAALATEQATLQTALTSATAQGTQASSVATATRTAASSVQALAARTQIERAQVAAAGTSVTAALAARTSAFAAVAAALKDSANQPLGDTEAKALKTAVAKANTVSEADLDAKGVAAVTKIDGDIAALGTAEATALAAAQTDLAAKQAALATARSAALALLATIQGSAADVTARLNAATANQTQAQQLSAGADAPSHHGAVVAYADYARARASLTSDAAADPTGSVLQGKWTAAGNAWLSALADVTAAGETVIAKQLALDTVLATQAAKRQTRDGDAAAAVATAFGQ